MKLFQVKQSSVDLAARLLLTCGAALLFYGSILEFHQIAWGTGVWLGQYSLRWALALLLFVSFCVFCLIGVWIILWRGWRMESTFRWLASFRDQLGPFRWILAVLFILLPVYFLQYTYWGKVLHEPYLRILLASLSSILLGWVLTKDRNGFINWSAGLTALVVLAGTYTFFVPLIEVTNYPFSLGWSEGNRLWDYSILFGRGLYNYPPDKPIPVLLDIGRRSIGGIPFLIPGIKIWQARLWLALIDIVPYLILGWVAFHLDRKHVWHWLLAGVWAFTFVHQGPIHPPLLLSAIVVAFAWKRPLWLAIPLIAVASYFAEISRLTWMFAPGLWAGMLELSGTSLLGRQLDKRAWTRAISTGAAGVFGGYAVPFLVPGLLQWAKSLYESPAVASVTNGAVSPGVTITSRVSATISTQPLLWSRLLPNATYGEGILLGLLLAVLPLIIVLVYLLTMGHWKLNLWQKFAIVLPLLAFLVVGLIASVKIGGGADLHNMDMFIIGLMFAGAVAWRSGGFKWIDEIHAAPVWVQFTMVALIVIPGYKSMMQMRPISITEDITTVATLADIHEDPLPNPLPDTLPSEPDTIKALNQVQVAVAKASQEGEVLFMDQRQLLTFGYIDVPLVPKYDKKVLINEALSANVLYFADFYRDLENQRFSLIVTNPVNRRLDKTEGHFGEENNAWVRWVSMPLLCYYEPLDRLKRVDVELLVPRQDISTCDEVLPISVSE
ncbi:MAG TPA: hypothetical protein VFQ13_00145 [Anaerolineales bacterium]|nr:hypothetical protein [Anaerolineales bacterium]